MATAIDPDAFGTFFRRHARGVLAFFRRRGASAEEAQRRGLAAEDPERSSSEPRGPWPSALRPARRRSPSGTATFKVKG